MAVSRQSSRWVDHTHEVIETLESLRLSMEKADSSYRGYVLTNQTAYLDIYYSSTARVVQEEAELRRLTADNPGQERQLAALQKLDLERIQESGQLIDLRRNRGEEAAADRLTNSKSIQTAKDFQQLMFQIKNEEFRLLAIRQGVSDLRATQTKAVLFLGTLVGILMATGAAVRIRRDASARDIAQEATRESEERFRNMANNISQMAWIADERGRFLWFNQRWFDFFGVTMEQLADPEWEAEVHHPDYRERVVQKLRGCFASGEPWEDTFPLKGRDGEFRWFLSRAVPIRNALGDVTSWFGTNTDITELQRVEQHVAQMESRYRGLLEAAPDAMVVVNPAGQIVLLNVQAENQFGYRRDELIGHDFTDIIPEGFAERLVADSLRSADEASAQQIGNGIELYGMRRDGSDFPIEIMLSPLASAEGILITAAIRNITARRKVEAALFMEKELAQVTLNCIGDSIACTDSFGKISFLNVAAEVLTGWSFNEAIGRPLGEVFAILDGATRREIKDLQEVAIEEEAVVHLPINSILIRRDGAEIPIEDSIAPINDREGNATGAVIVFRDVSIARATALQIAHLAEHDFLTGLPNRLLLNDRIRQAIARANRNQQSIAIMFLDLDGFKHINDSLGHAVGDKILQAVAGRLVNCVRASDTVSRQGGDEFVVLLNEVEHPKDSTIAAKRMLEAIAEAYSVDNNDLHLTTSIGVSVYPDDGVDAETLIKNADTAMYRAKENGRQSCQFFEAAMNVQAVERQTIEESLRRALKRDEFILQYQPKINIETGEIVGAEVLIRWNHPIRGLVPPGQFIPVAEDCGLILPISRWVLREACKQAVSWSSMGLPPVSVAVNISAMDFRDENFLENVFSILDETGLDPNYLELELTESVLMKRAEAAEAKLKSLRARGIQIAVDDFGTGYSSLSYLRQFSIDALKIDQSFIRQLTITPEETTIVAAMISMGRSLKLRVIAEGVETERELSFLREHRCDEVQGFLFSRPVNSEAFASLLQDSPFVVHL